MLKINVLLVLVAFLSFDLRANAIFPNHAILDAKHDFTAENFINRNLKLNGEYDLVKIDEFISRLDKEFEVLKSDIYETQIIEAIDIHIVSIEEARQRALEQIQGDKNGLIRVFKNYLKPSILKIREAVNMGLNPDHIEGLVDNFIELYHIYFVPELPRRRGDHDRSNLMLLTMLNGLKYSKINKGVQANNLVAGKLEENIENCIGQDISPLSPLSQNELEAIESCGIDLSKLNPIRNPMIKNLTLEQKEKRKYDFLHLFPSGDEKFKYEFMIYTGAGSPKFVGSFIKNINGENKKITFKVKLGKETHQDPTASMLGKLIGLTQDHSKAYRTMKIYITNTTVEGFIAQWIRKYKKGLKDISKFIKARSREGDTEQWIEFKDVSIEIRDPELTRLTPFDPWGWDLPNRREHRSLALWYAFISVRDMKTDNHVVHVKEMNDKYELIYSPQDVGISFGHSIDLRNPIGSIASSGGKTVNYFRPSFLSWSDQHIHLHWLDTITNRRKFLTTTYDDLKWMARKIASLTQEDIDYAFTLGGYPKPVVELYKIKLGMRINEIIKGFNLENEFKQRQLPDLHTYNYEPYIKNGIVVVDGFEGHVLYEASTYSSDIARKLIFLISKNIPIERMFGGINAALDNGLSISANDAIAQLSGNTLGKVFKFDAIHGNINFTIKRNVILNQADYAIGPNEMGRYLVKDTLTVGFGVGSDLDFNLIKKHLPVSVRSTVTLYERSYEHMQVASNWKEALSMPLGIFTKVLTPMTGMAEGLDPGDVIKIQDRVGFKIDATAGVSLTQTPFLQLDFQLGMGWSYSRPLYIHRDQLGDTLIFRETRRDFYMNASAYLLGVDFTFLDEFPLLGISYSYDKIDKKSELFKFRIASKSKGSFHRLLQKKELNAFFEGGNPILYSKNKIMDIHAHGHIKRFQFDFMLFFHSARSSSFFKIEVDGQEGKKNFYRYHLMSESFVGDKQLGSVIGSNPWIFVRKQNQWSVNIELEEKNINGAVAVLEYQNYHKNLTRRGLDLFIENLNRQYSSDGTSIIFSTEHIPPDWEVKNYFKVFSFMRVHVGIGNFIASVNPNTFKVVKRRVMANARSMELRLPRAFLFILKRGINKIQKNRLRPAKQVKAVASLLKYINKQRESIRLLKEVMGSENIFVFGELVGVYQGYTLTSEQDAVPTRRFAAKSWGGFKGIAPIRKYLKNNLVAPIYLHLLTDDISNDVFGKLPRTGTPPII